MSKRDIKIVKDYLFNWNILTTTFFSGTICGALWGTMLCGITGTIFGVIIGTLVVGVINKI